MCAANYFNQDFGAESMQDQKKQRGRPKGSTNKPKDTQEVSNLTANPTGTKAP